MGFKVCPGRPVIMPRRLCRAGGAVVNHLKLVKDVGRLGVFMFVLKYHFDPNRGPEAFTKTARHEPTILLKMISASRLLCRYPIISVFQQSEVSTI